MTMKTVCRELHAYLHTVFRSAGGWEEGSRRVLEQQIDGVLRSRRMFPLLRSSQLSQFERLLECCSLTEDLKHMLVISSVGQGWEGYVGGKWTDSWRTGRRIWLFLQLICLKMRLFSNFFFYFFFFFFFLRQLQQLNPMHAAAGSNQKASGWTSDFNPHLHSVVSCSCWQTRCSFPRLVRQHGQKNTGKLWSLNFVWTLCSLAASVRHQFSDVQEALG